MTDSSPSSAPPLPVGIVGAGVAGLAAATALGRAGVPVEIAEKSRGPGGRAATRRRDGAAYDFGATSFVLDGDRDGDGGGSEAARTFLASVDGLTGALVRLDGDVWVWDDEAASPRPGDPARQHARWTVDGGINRLGHRLLAASGATLHARTRIAALEPAGSADAPAWTLIADDGRRLGPYRALVLTAPAPQTAELLRAAAGDAGAAETGAAPPNTPARAAAHALADALDAVPYAPQFALTVAVDAPAPRPGGACALLVRRRDSPLAWVSFEASKAGFVPADGDTRGVLVAQATPEWTAAHLDDAPEAVAAALLAALADALGPLPGILWTDLHRWRYARPLAALAAPRPAARHGLYIAGDATAGRADIAAALASGLTAAASVLEG